MNTKIEEAQEEFNSILQFVVNGALDLQIHEVEDRIYRMLLRLGRILLELFVLSMGTGKTGEIFGQRRRRLVLVSERFGAQVFVHFRRDHDNAGLLCRKRTKGVISLGRKAQSSRQKVFLRPPGLDGLSSGRNIL